VGRGCEELERMGHHEWIRELRLERAAGGEGECECAEAAGAVAAGIAGGFAESIHGGDFAGSGVVVAAGGALLEGRLSVHGGLWAAAG